MPNFCKNCGKKILTGTLCNECVPQQHGNAQSTATHNVQTIFSQNTLQVAKSDKRLINYILDFIGVYAFGFIFGFVLATIGQGQIIDNANESLLGLFLFVTYYLFFESIWQKTPAKWITKTKVVMQDGSKPDFKHILGRSFARLIPFEPFSFLGKNPTGWHDTLSKTIVINER